MLGHPNLQFHGTGQDYNDHSQNGFVGTNSGVDIVPGIIGDGLFVNALTDKIDYGNQAILNFERTNSFTICFWLKGAIPSARANLFGKSPGPTPKGWWVANSGAADGNGMVELFLINNWGSNWLLVRGGQMSSAWQHFAFTYPGTSNANDVKMYVNGISITPSVPINTLSASILTTASMTIGTISTAQATMSSTMDDLQIYNYVLPASDVKRVMTGKHPLARS